MPIRSGIQQREAHVNACRNPAWRWSPGLAVVAILASAASQAASQAADPIPPSAAGTSPVVARPLPPPALGRTVIADVHTLSFVVPAGQRQLKDFDAEESAVIAQINRSPSTWQTYLLYTSEDLPDRLFCPGFTFVLGHPEKREARRALAAKSAAPPTLPPPPEN